MKHTIDRLLEADVEARQLVEQALRYRDDMKKKTQEECECIRRQYEEKALHHENGLRISEDESARESVAGIHKTYAALTQALEARYEQCHEEWERELFARAAGQVSGDE